jgi:hypothetical protein
MITKEEIEAKRKELAYLEAQFEAQSKHTPEKAFIEMLNGCVIKIDERYPNSIFFMKDDEMMFELKESTFWCRYSKCWGVLQNKFDLQHYEIQNVIQGVLEQQLKMKVSLTCGNMPTVEWVAR